MTCSMMMDSPIGILRLVASQDGLHEIAFPQSRSPAATSTCSASPPVQARGVFEVTVAQLDEYFAGMRRVFDLPLAPRGTPFQLDVWRALAAIPFGETTSYAQLAARLGRPTASRAVGAANGRNPLPIVVPCHRVIGADGSLTGFAGGLETKRFLLAHEGAWPKAGRFAA